MDLALMGGSEPAEYPGEAGNRAGRGRRTFDLPFRARRGRPAARRSAGVPSCGSSPSGKPVRLWIDPASKRLPGWSSYSPAARPLRANWRRGGSCLPEAPLVWTSGEIVTDPESVAPLDAAEKAVLARTVDWPPRYVKGATPPAVPPAPPACRTRCRPPGPVPDRPGARRHARSSRRPRPRPGRPPMVMASSRDNRRWWTEYSISCGGGRGTPASAGAMISRFRIRPATPWSSK